MGKGIRFQRGVFMFGLWLIQAVLGEASVTFSKTLVFKKKKKKVWLFFAVKHDLFVVFI